MKTDLGTEHQTVFVISALLMWLAHTWTDMVKQTSHVHNRSHEEASHCMIHTSEFETVGLPIYEALELGLKVVVPNLEYINLENENIFKYEFGNYSSAINAIDESIKNLEKVYCDVPIYYENWNLG